MLYLDTENSVLNPAAIRAIKNTRLGELKRIFGVYFGFTTATELANYFALSQAIGNAAAAETNPETRGAAGSASSVAASRRDLNVRVDPLLAPVFAILLDTGGGSKKILPSDGDSTAIMTQLNGLLQGTGQNLSNIKHSISRCVKIHVDPEAITTVTELINSKPDKIIFNDLDRALPVMANEDTRFKKRISVIRAEHPLLIPGEKNGEFLTVFFNGMPALEMTRAIPVMNVKFYSSRQVFEENKLAAITLQKFVEGAKTIASTIEDLPIRAIALASQVPTGSIPGQLATARDFPNYTVTGLELFRAPQTMINQETARNRENYLAPIIDPMRPLASIKSFSMDVKSAYGLQGTRTATLEIVLHDRSRMGEFADFIKPDRYGESFIEVEYGWSHPDRLGENPYADLLNLTRAVDHFTVVGSNFSFDDVGQVNLTLSLIGRGSSEITELSIIGQDAAGRIQTQIRQIERLSETINQLSGLVFPPPPENRNGNTNQRRTEVRGAQGLSAASDATNNLLLSKEVLDSLRKLQTDLNGLASSSNRNIGRRQNAIELQRALRQLISGTTNLGGSATSPSTNSAISAIARTLNQEVREILNKLNPVPQGTRRTRDNWYGDTFLSEMPAEAWDKLKTRIDTTRTTRGLQPEISNTQLPSTNNNAASARTVAGENPVDRFNGAAVVSLGTLISAFVGKPLAALKTGDNPKFEEVQLYFYNFNNRASIMSHCNISQFPVQTDYFVREYGRLRMENVGRSVNLSVSEFMNFISTKIVDDVLNPAYGINDLYKYDRNELVPNNRNFDSEMYVRMQRNNIGHHTDFVPPQLTFEIEATEAVIDGRIQQGRSILKIHIYDKACSPNSSYREILSLGTNNVLSVLSSYPGDNAQRQALETQARERREDIGVLRENWRQLQSDIVQRCSAPPRLIERIQQATDANGRAVEQYRFVGGAQQLKEFVMRGIPHIIYGAMGTTVRSSNVGSMSDPNLNTINMLRSLNASPIQPNGEQVGGVPLSVYPVEVNLTSLGCPLLRYGQELFIDYNTNTSIDNIYYVTGLQHKIEAGSFETTIKFTAVDAFGQYRNLIGQINSAEITLSEMQGDPINGPTTPRSAPQPRG